MNGNWRLELQRLQIDLRSYIRDFANLHPAKLYRRARSEPAHRLIEEEFKSLRITRGRFECLRPRGVQRKNGVRLCDGKKLATGWRLEPHTGNQDRQQRLGLHAEPVS